MGPLTTVELTAPGPFSIKIPKDTEVMINALCDEDGDKKIVGGKDKLARGEMLKALSEDKGGVELTLDDTGAVGGGGGGGGPKGGAGGAGGPPEGGPDGAKGGPPAGGPQGGPPPEGGAQGGPPPEGAPAGK